MLTKPSKITTLFNNMNLGYIDTPAVITDTNGYLLILYLPQVLVKEYQVGICHLYFFYSSYVF